MPKSKKPIDASLSGPVVDLARELRELRAQAGNPSYDTMAVAGLSCKANLSTADNGVKLPTRDVTLAYVKACGGDLEQWAQRWQVAKDLQDEQEKQRLTTPVAVPAAMGEPPSPLKAMDAAEFREKMREVHQWAGTPAYRDMARQAAENQLNLARSTISDMLSPTKTAMPTAAKLISLLTVCNLPADHHPEWLQVQEAILKAQSRDRRKTLARSASVDPAARPDAVLVRIAPKSKTGTSRQPGTLHDVRADLPKADPLVHQAWRALNPAAVDNLQRQLGLQPPRREPPPPEIRRRSRIDRAWTSEPPIIVTIIVVTVILATVVGSFYVLAALAGWDWVPPLPEMGSDLPAQ